MKATAHLAKDTQTRVLVPLFRNKRSVTQNKVIGKLHKMCDDFEDFEDEGHVDERYWKKKIEEINKDGYRSGLEDGQEESLQSGFDEGFGQSAQLVWSVARLRGFISGKLTYNLKNPGFLRENQQASLETLLGDIVELEMSLLTFSPKLLENLKNLNDSQEEESGRVSIMSARHSEIVSGNLEDNKNENYDFHATVNAQDDCESRASSGRSKDFTKQSLKPCPNKDEVIQELFVGRDINLGGNSAESAYDSDSKNCENERTDCVCAKQVAIPSTEWHEPGSFGDSSAVDLLSVGKESTSEDDAHHNKPCESKSLMSSARNKFSFSNDSVIVKKLNNLQAEVGKIMNGK